MRNNYNTKSKGAWKYITTLILTLNVDTNIIEIVAQLFSYKRTIGVVLPVVHIALQIWINLTKSYFKGETKSTYVSC